MLIHTPHHSLPTQRTVPITVVLSPHSSRFRYLSIIINPFVTLLVRDRCWQRASTVRMLRSAVTLSKESFPNGTVRKGLPLPIYGSNLRRIHYRFDGAIASLYRRVSRWFRR